MKILSSFLNIFLIDYVNSNTSFISSASTYKSIPKNDGWIILHKYHYNYNNNRWIQNRDLFETKFSEEFVFFEGILLPNDIYWVQFVTTSRFNIRLTWWNETPEIIDKTIQFQIIRKCPINRAKLSVNFIPKHDLPLIVSINSEEDGIFWQSIFQRFNLQFSGISKLDGDSCFGFMSRYFISECYKAGRSFYFVPKGLYLVIKTMLYCSFKFNLRFIDKVTYLNGVDVWIIKENVYRETIIKFFEFYYSFDKFAFSFEEIDQCSYNNHLVEEIWRENKIHSNRKEYYLKS
jgi:hypothetical protein